MKSSSMKLGVFLLLVLFMTVSCTPAVKKPQRADVTDKERADIHYKMGLIYIEEQRLGDALKELTTAVEKYPDEATYYNALGTAFFFRRMNEEAALNYKKAVALDPKYSEAFLNLGSVYIEMGKWDLAVAASKNVFNNIFYATLEDAYNNIGWALFKKGDFVQAIVNFRKAIELQPRYAMAYNNMGLTYERLRKWDKALKAYDSAIKSNSSIDNPYFNKGFLLMNLDRNEESIEVFEELIKALPDSGFAETAREYIDLMK